MSKMDVFKTLGDAMNPLKQVDELCELAKDIDEKVKQAREQQNLPKKINIIIVQSRNKRSLHGSFKKTCDCYGWDYSKLIRGGVPSSVGKYRIFKQETEVTIESMEMRRFLLSGKFEITNDHDDSWDDSEMSDHIQVEFTFIQDEAMTYIVNATFYCEHSIDHIATDRGDMDASSWDVEIDEIESIYDQEGDEIQIDLKTEFILKQLLNL